MDFGTTGIWTTYRAIGEQNAGEAAAVVEELGFGALWLGGSPRLPQLRPLLESTDGLIVGSSIVNIWAYEPAELAAEYAALERDFPGRVIVGIGVGHPEATSDYTRPLTAMRRFLDGVDAEGSLPPQRRCVAALGPRMLDLAAERSLGAIPYFTSVGHTRDARARIGSALLVPELATGLDADPARAREKADAYAATYLGLSNYTNNLLNHGFTEDDIADGGSDRLIDEVVPNGGIEAVTAIAQAHFAAGADHVVLQAVGERGIPREAWAALATISAG